MDKYIIPAAFNAHCDKHPNIREHFKYINKRYHELSEYNRECSSELTKICEKYKEWTDKGPNGPYYIKHNYTEIYGDLLRFHKDKNVDVLEIGVRHGGSTLMWKDYFAFGMIHGIDIDTSTIQANLNHERIKIYKGDAYKENVGEDMFKGQKFDVIIEDGSHTLPHLIKCLNIYSKLLKDEGILILEDVKNMEWAREIIDNFTGRVNKCSIINRSHCVPSLGDINVIYYK